MSKINDDPKDSLLKQYRDEMERLKQLLNFRNKLQIHLRYGDKGGILCLIKSLNEHE